MKALITGASHGLGHALARSLLAERQAAIIALDRDLGSLEELGSDVTALIGDLGDRESLEILCAEAADAGPYDLVVMNAGINATGPFQDIPIAMQRPIIDVNLAAPMILTAALLATKNIRSGATLVFISSLSHFIGYPGAATYAASKEGLAVFARSLRKPLRASGIHVLTVFPGPMDTTHASRHAPPGAARGYRRAPEAVARAILAKLGRSGDLVPGLGPRLLSLSGRFLPGLTTKCARKLLFEPYAKNQ